jgi:Protein of unknown function (DUF3592)
LATTTDETPSDKSISGYGSIPEELVWPGIFAALTVFTFAFFAANDRWIEASLLALVWLIITVYAAKEVRRTRRAMARLREIGVHAAAVITKREWTSGGNPRDISRWIYYQYEAGGRQRNGHRRFSIGWPFYRRRVKVGDQIDILYDPADPDVSIWMD